MVDVAGAAVIDIGKIAVQDRDDAAVVFGGNARIVCLWIPCAERAVQQKPAVFRPIGKIRAQHGLLFLGAFGENDGDLFIGVGIEDNHGGFGCPCDSIEEAIERLKAGMKNRDLLREPKGETNAVHYSG